MASGNISITTSNGYITGNIAWTSTADVPNNRSYVTATLTYSKVSGTEPTFGDGTFYLTINENTMTLSAHCYFDIPSTLTIGSHSVYVDHQTDGSKSITISASGGIPGSSFVTSSGSGTVVLDTILRTSVVGTVPDFTIEDAFSVPVTKYSSSFTDMLTISAGGQTIKTVAGYTGGTSITFTDGEILSAYGKITSGSSATFSFYVTTYSGETTIGTSATKTAAGTAAGTGEVMTASGWTRAVPWVKILDTWKRSVFMVNAGCFWKRGL